MSALYNIPTTNNVQFTLGSGYSVGGSTLTLNQSVAGIIQAPGVVVIDRIDSNNNKTPTKRTYYAFTGVSSANLTGVTVADGTDQSHSIGAIVEAVVDITTIGSLRNALANIVNTSTSAVDSTKVPVVSGGFSTTLTTTASTNVTLPTTGTVSTLAGTETLTNKRITKRVVSATSYTTDTGTSLNCDTTDAFIVTAQAGALKFNNPSGTGTQGQPLLIRITDDGTARALTYDTQFRAMGTALPSTTVLSKTLYMLFIFNSTSTKWDLVAAGQEA